MLRKLLLRHTRQLEFRDLDVVRTVSTTDDHDHRLSMKYMEDDYEFGRGVELEVLSDMTRCRPSVGKTNR